MFTKVHQDNDISLVKQDRFFELVLNRPRLSLTKNHSNSHSGPKRVTFLSENSLLQSGEKSESATLLTTLFATLESVYLQAKYFAILCNLPLPNAKQ